MKALVSGGFDPVHGGHLDLIEAAAKYGRVIVALNTDEWLKRKKGYVFMDWKHRAKVLMAMRHVFRVVKADDNDDTITKTILTIKPDYFINGGDRESGNAKESAACRKVGTIEIFGAGGGKTHSSSELVKAVDNHKNTLSS